MTAQAAIKQADIERLFKAAKTAGVAVQITIGGAVVTVIPDINSPATVAPDAKIVKPKHLAPDGEENLNAHRSARLQIPETQSGLGALLGSAAGL